MGRIERGYELKIRALLRQINAGKAEERVGRLLGRARRLAAEQRIPHSQALGRVVKRLQKQIARWQKRASGSSQPAVPAARRAPPRFLCDAGLGGLARWLRAAGYEAGWISGIDDDELLRQASRSGATRPAPH